MTLFAHNLFQLCSWFHSWMLSNAEFPLDFFTTSLKIVLHQDQWICFDTYCDKGDVDQPCTFPQVWWSNGTRSSCLAVFTQIPEGSVFICHAHQWVGGTHKENEQFLNEVFAWMNRYHIHLQNMKLTWWLSWFTCWQDECYTMLAPGICYCNHTNIWYGC